MPRSLSSKRFAVLVVSVLMLAVTAAPAGADSHVDEPLISGLVGPLGLAVGSDGTVYVADAFAGSLTAIDPGGGAEVIVDAPGTEIAGVDAKAGLLVFTQTVFDGEPGEEAPPLDATLERVLANGSTQTIASTQSFEASHNPDSVNTYGLDTTGLRHPERCLAAWPTEILGPPTYQGIVESHPYAVAIVRGGYVVADAAANALFRVSSTGAMSTIAVLPPIPQKITADLIAGLPPELANCIGASYAGEPVPTDVEVGRDGYYYVSTLPGGPEAPGAGAVWKVHPRTGAVTLVTAGLTTPVDIAIGPDGTIWVAELFGFQISTIKNGVVSPYMFAPLPGAIEVGPDGSVYAVINALPADDGPPNGQVIRITP